MREALPEKLWIGNALHARNVTAVLGLGITVIIDLVIEEPPIQFPRDAVYCRFPLIDGSENQPAILCAPIEMTATFEIHNNKLGAGNYVDTVTMCKFVKECQDVHGSLGQ